MSAVRGRVRLSDRSGRLRLTALALAASLIISGLPAAAYADDSLLQYVGLDLGVAPVENQTLSQVRGQGIDAPALGGPADTDFAVILWDERKLGGVGGPTPSAVGPVNSNAPGTMTSVTTGN